MGKPGSHSHPESFGRRSFLRGAGYLAAAVPALTWLSGAAGAPNARAVVGCVKPRMDSNSLQELMRFLPQGVRLVPVYLNLAEGTREELQSTYPVYEKNIAALAAQRCDLISIEGAPPFMLLGRDGETKMVDGWKQKYKIDMFTSSQNQVNVLKAMKIRKILGITAFGADLNRSYAKYFEDSGISVVAMEGMTVSFQNISRVPSETIYAFIKQKFAEHKGADAIYVLGSGLKVLDIVAKLEQDLGVPVVQPVAARAWEIERRLHIRQPIKGYGRLLETLPA